MQPLESIQSAYGTEPKTSDWYQVQQPEINQFAAATGDHNWLHVDPERAAREGPFGGTFAHGFWTLSRLTWFGQQVIGQSFPTGALYGLNYGLDRVRMIAPVRVGSRIRCHIRLLEIIDKGRGRYLVKTEHTVEVEDEEKPAMVAEWLVMLFFPET